MEEQGEETDSEVQSWRSQLMPLLNTMPTKDVPHLYQLELFLQVATYILILKFPVDYLSEHWVGHETAILSYLDVSYLVTLAGKGSYKTSVILAIVVCILYAALNATILFMGKSSSTNDVWRRACMLVLSSLFYLFPLNAVLNMGNCGNPSYFSPCLGEFSWIWKLIAQISFAGASILLNIQVLLKFEFTFRKGVQRQIIRESSFSSFCVLNYMLINQIAFRLWPKVVAIAILNVAALLLLIIVVAAEEHQNESLRVTELSLAGLNMAIVLCADGIYFLKIPLSLIVVALLLLLIPIVCYLTSTYTLKYELQNINKWSTPQMMIRHCTTLRNLLRHQNRHEYVSKLHGYVDVHRQKCDNPQCPYLTPRHSRGSNDGPKADSDEVERTRDLIKFIFSEGYKQSPVSTQLELRYASFLNQVGNYDGALNILLKMDYRELSFDQYYVFWRLRKVIHEFLLDQPDREFLDLVSEQRAKAIQVKITQLFKKLALTNLQFWSVLNEGHPDFKKLNKVGLQRITLREELQQNYKQICAIANNQKIVGLYAHYLILIENHEDIYSTIQEQIQESFDLTDKITIHDWANSSVPTLLISTEEVTFANIIDANCTCAGALGYERFELINRSIGTIFPEALRSLQKAMLMDFTDSDDILFLQTKNNYVIKTQTKARQFNSIQTGSTCILSLVFSHNITNCMLLFSSEQKLIGYSSSCLSLLGLPQKILSQYPKLENILLLPSSDVLKDQRRSRKGIPISELMSNESDKQSLTSILYTLSSTKINDTHQIIIYLESLTIAPQEESSNASSSSSSTLQPNKHFGSRVLGHPNRGNNQRPSSPADRNSNSLKNGFAFYVNATEHEFGYVGFTDGNQGGNHAAIGLQRAKSIKNGFKFVDFGRGIITLRLMDNVIQVIEEEEQEESTAALAAAANQDEQSEADQLLRRDEELIFESKTSYENLIKDYSIRYSPRGLLAIGLALTLAIYGACLGFLTSSNLTLAGSFQQIAYQNMIIGSIAKEYSFLWWLKQVQSSSAPPTSLDVAQTILRNHEDILYLESIKKMGSAPFFIQTETQKFYSDELILTIVNYALNFYYRVASSKSLQQVRDALDAQPPNEAEYLWLNSNSTRLLMTANLQKRKSEIESQFSSSIRASLGAMAALVFAQLMFALGLLAVIRLVNGERIQILSIFLGITEHQIQQFSLKTEKFLAALHIEETASNTDNQIESEGRQSNSMFFVKKKRFKFIELERGIYLKILLIPLLAAGFFVHSFIQNYGHASLMKNTVDYVEAVSAGTNVLFTQLAGARAVQIDQSVSLHNNQILLKFSGNLFEKHAATIGIIKEYHAFFTTLQMGELCNGTIQIQDACKLGSLSSNGALVVLTDITIKNEAKNPKKDFARTYYLSFQVLSSFHQVLTMKVLSIKDSVTADVNVSLLLKFVFWTLILGAAALVFGFPVLRQFMKEFKNIVDLLTVLPLSVAKDLPAARKRLANMISR